MVITQIFVPTENTITISIPNEWINKKIKVIAFDTQDVSTYPVMPEMRKRTIEEALEFWNKNAVDTGKREKWTREDLNN